ncbi:MAG: AarF/UbiB family protein [Anaerolineae bacterium]|nr:AarF/UbiB family protein [Anaerolineae bacterium]
MIDIPPAIDRQRYQRIIWFFTGLLAHVIWWDIVLRRIIPGRVLSTRSDRWRAVARRFRLLAVDMGGVLIKLGQFLSSRVDVLPPEIIGELQGLQDEVPAVPTAEILEVMRAELGDLEAHFASIEPEPLAAASLGQAYRAWLCPHDKRRERGAPVVIKVQRPGIEKLVQTDLAALRRVARWMMHYPPIRRRADMPALLEEFAATLWEELDYELEADNAERFAEMFAADDGVYIPLVYRRHSTRRVLVLENVEGIKITDVAAIEAAGVDRAEVANRLLDTYFHQIFKEGFFHADPHPGNLFVWPRAEQLEDGPRTYYLVFVDFGMVGHIETLTGDKLRRLLIAISQQDSRALTESYRDLGFLLPSADLERITEAQAILLEQLWGRELLELTQPDPAEIQEITREFKDILFDFPFQIPQDFIYLGRAMGMLSGLSSLLDPQINPWRKVEEYGREIVRRSGTGATGWEMLVTTLRPMLTLPGQMQRVLTAAEQGRLRVQMAPDPALLQRLDRIERRLGITQMTVAIASVAGSVLLFWRHRREQDKEQ